MLTLLSGKRREQDLDDFDDGRTNCHNKHAWENEEDEGEQQFEAAFDKLLEAGADALLIAGGANFNSQRQAIIALAARHALPTMYTSRDYVAAGGLISYSASVANAYRQAGVYAGKILKGTKPSELPVLLPTKFELVINLNTAKALGLAVPDKLLVAADEVIE